MDLDLKNQLFPLDVHIIRKLRDELKKYSMLLKLFHILHSKLMKMHVFKNSVLVVIIFTQVSKSFYYHLGSGKEIAPIKNSF